jgi:hypothetical protein
MTVEFNGTVIHEKLKIPRRRHPKEGPIQLQDHGHNIQFRNIWLVEG